MVAPNAAEAEEAVGHEFNEPEDLQLGVGGLLEMGAGEAIVTTEYGCSALGRRGPVEAALRGRDRAARGGRCVGSGDAFLAGYVAARYEGSSAADCLAYGVACGAESTQHFGAGVLAPREVERLLSRVEVRELESAGGDAARSSGALVE